MARVYVRVHVGLMDDEDYMALSPTGIAAWHTVNMLQGAQTEERFKSRTQIVALLRRHGFGDFAPGAVEELERCGWVIDHPDLPGVVLKGWERWQAKSQAEYMRDYRASRKPNVRHTSSSRSDTSHVPSPHVPDAPPREYTREEEAAIAEAKAKIESLLKDVPGRRAKKGRPNA